MSLGRREMGGNSLRMESHYVSKKGYRIE